MSPHFLKVIQSLRTLLMSPTIYWIDKNCLKLIYPKTGAPNLPLTMYPFSISTDEYVRSPKILYDEICYHD